MRRNIKARQLSVGDIFVIWTGDHLLVTSMIEVGDIVLVTGHEYSKRTKLTKSVTLKKSEQVRIFKYADENR